MPFDIAFAMTEGGLDAEVLAWIVVIGENEGGKFNWNTLEFERDDD